MGFTWLAVIEGVCYLADLGLDFFAERLLDLFAGGGFKVVCLCCCCININCCC